MRVRNLGLAMLLIFGLCFIVPSNALALPIGSTTPMTFSGVSPGRAVLTNQHNYGVSAGIYNLLVGEEQENADSFCIEFDQWAPTGTNDYQYTELSNIFVGQTDVVDNISKLWYQYYSDNMSNNKAAGLQIAIWEVTQQDHELHVRTGDFQILGQAFGAQTMLNSLGSITLPDEFALYALAHDSYQDYLINKPPTPPNAPVPEPATMLLLGTGLAGGALYRRRKRLKN